MKILTLLREPAVRASYWQMGALLGRRLFLRTAWTGSLIAAGLFFGPNVASAADIVIVPEGNLLLEMVNRPRFRFESEIQEIQTPPGNSNCNILSSPQNLVKITGFPDGAGLLNTNSKKLIGTVGPGVGCGRIDQSEWLEFELSGVIADKVFSAVDLALNAKFNAVATAQVFNGGEPAGTFKLYTGTSIPPNLGANEASCAPGSDSTPDNDATNCRWKFAAAGDVLRITVVAGQLGIGGLGSTSIFQIADSVPATGQINCGDTTDTVEFVDADGRPIEGANAFVQCRRLDNVVSPSVCEVVNYSLTASCNSGSTGCNITLLHANEPADPFNSTKFAFICETWWPEQTGNFLEGTLDLPKTQQFFGSNDLQGTDLDFCEGVTPVFEPRMDCVFDSGGNVSYCPPSDIESVQVPLQLDHQAQVPGQQLGCLLDERVRQVEDLDQSIIDVLLKLYQMWYLQGDYTALRGLR